MDPRWEALKRLSRESHKDNQEAFEFLFTATTRDIYELGWRIGEKWDSASTDDFLDFLIVPFLQGIVDGASCTFPHHVTITTVRGGNRPIEESMKDSDVGGVG